MKLIAEGAEAQIFDVGNGLLKKVRVSKGYRVKDLDEKLRKARNKREFKVLNKLLEGGVNVPKAFDLNDSKEDTFFTFENIRGDVLKEKLNEVLLLRVFDEIIKMHNLGVVHGDLTTLNAIVREKDEDHKSFSGARRAHPHPRVGDKSGAFADVANGGFDDVYLIDFGLAEFSEKVEDRAVDLNLFFTCLKNEHPDFYSLKKDLISIYEKKVDRGNDVALRLEAIEKRGRNK